MEWIRRHAISFQPNGTDGDFSDLQPLKALIGDARIVQLGEQSHGDGSCFEAKIRLIQFLHQEMDFDVLAFESGLYDCDGANHAFSTDIAPLEAAQQGIFGIWTGCKQIAPLWDYVSSSAKTDRRLDLAGFDCQFTGSASTEHFVDDLTAIAAKYRVAVPSVGKTTNDEFLKQLQHLASHEEFTGSKKDWLATLDSIIASIDLAKPIVADDEQELFFWRQQLRSLKAYGSYSIPASSAFSFLSGNSLNARDAQMADNLIWLTQRRYPGRKIIVWAASFHIMRNAAEIEVPDKSVNYSTIIPMGHVVAQKLGDNVFTVGFTAGGGQAGAWFRPPFDIASPPAGTLEDLCLRADLETAVLPLRDDSPEAKWLSETFYSRPLGYSWMRARWGRHFDAMIFQKNMVPATEFQ